MTSHVHEFRLSVINNILNDTHLHRPIVNYPCLGGYKGYGLAMMVEVLCGIMSGATYGPNIRHWGTFDKPANLVRHFSVDNYCWVLSLG